MQQALCIHNRKQNLIAFIEDKDDKLAEMDRNLMIANKNTADLSKNLADKDELLEQLKREHKIELNEAEVESKNLKKKIKEID